MSVLEERRHHFHLWVVELFFEVVVNGIVVPAGAREDNSSDTVNVEKDFGPLPVSKEEGAHIV